MGDGTSKMPTFSGEGFMDWSEKMKTQLISEGLWSWVEEGVKEAETAEQRKQEMMNDANALFIICKSLSPDIFMTVVRANTAKEAWDTLHNTFMPKEKMNKALQGCLNDEAPSTDVPMIELSSSDDDDSSNTLPDVGDGDKVKPLSRDKPFFDIALTKSAVNPLFRLNFSSRLDSILPSKNVQAVVRLSGRVYEIKFYGSRQQKSFGSGWRQLVEDHNLEEGDFLVFEIMKCNEDELEINLQLLKNTLPPELEQEIERRKEVAANKPKVVIDISDSSTSDED